MKFKLDKTRRLVLAALLIALSFIGAQLTLFYSIAFDSMPAFLAALVLGPVYGAAIGFLGHLLTAITSGFPLTLPLHIVIAFTMALTMLAFGYVFNFLKGRVQETIALVATGITGVIFNGPISLTFSILALWLMVDSGAALFLLTLLPVLLLASAINVVIAIILYRILQKVGIV